MKQVAAISAVVSLFVVGVLVGTLGTHLYYSKALAHHGKRLNGPPEADFAHRGNGSPRHRGPFRRPLPDGTGPPSHSGERVSTFLQQRLNLNDEQTQEIQRLIARRDQLSHELRKEMEPRVRAFLEQTDAEIERLLTTEQSAQWKKLRDSERQRVHGMFLRGRERRGLGRPGGPGGGLGEFGAPRSPKDKGDHESVEAEQEPNTDEQQAQRRERPN